MLDHEEKFLFKEEILHLSNAVAEPGVLDNVEDLLTDVITSPRFDSEVFTLERSLQVMLGPRAGTTLVGLLTVAPEVFDIDMSRCMFCGLCEEACPEEAIVMSQRVAIATT